jgi:carboxyl-terminal processing protease
MNRKGYRPLLVIVFLFTLGASGVLLGAASSDAVLSAAKDRYQDLQIFTKVLNLVQQYYVEPVDTKKLIYGGIKGMLQELDPHTNFLPPDIYKEFENETSGEFGGIGIEITVQNDVLTVISPIEDTPAWEAGIKAGDKIVEINGDSTKGLSLAEAAQKMRGGRGSKMKMMIFRDGFEKPREFTVTRGVVKIKSVKVTDLEDGYLYIKLTSFIENSAPDVEKALKNATAKNKEIKGLVLDLRRNPGGLLDQAVKIADLFLEKGVIVSTIGRNKKDKTVEYAHKGNDYPEFPVIVLVNEYSASASEILSGALQDNKRALIMGQRTFGKGSVQSVVKLGDGSGLKLTVARYYTPSGVSIQAEGIKPDVVIDEVDPEAFKKAVVRKDIRREQDIARHLPGDRESKEKEQNPTTGIRNPDDPSNTFWWTQDSKKKDLSPKEKLLSEDFQVLQAYNYLRAWKVMQNYKGQEIPAAATASADEAPAATPAAGEKPSVKPAPVLKPATKKK